MKTLILALLFLLFSYSSGRAQVYSDSEAKQTLRDWNCNSGYWIENAERITVEGCQVQGEGGLCINLPILVCVKKDEIVLLRGASGYTYDDGTILVKADGLAISAVYLKSSRGRLLIVGESLKAIVNTLLANR